MNITIIDEGLINPGDVSWSGFKELGELTVWNGKGERSLPVIIEKLQGTQIAMLPQSVICRNVLENCRELQMITLTSTGYDKLSPELLRYARERKVTICNVPAYGTPAVAQHAFALLLELCNHVGYHNYQVHEGCWKNSENFYFYNGTLMELSGKTMGILGFGAIGQAVARIADGFGMKTLAYSPHIRKNSEELAESVSLEELYRRSDIISLHCPLKAETKEIINKNSIDKMREGAMIINTARGGLLQEEDVARALNSGKLGGAGLDVISREPVQDDNPLLHAKNCIITPHMAWMPKETRQRLIDCAVENVRAYLKGEPVHVINP